MLRRKAAPFHLDWLQIEVSSLCNRSCPYCAASCLSGQRETGLMDRETFECLRPSLGSAGLVYLQGWGEPLLHPELWSMIRQVKAAGAVAGFTTNATLLDASSGLEIIRSGVDVVAVSLAGADPSTQERLRPGCGLARIDAALASLKNLKRLHGARTPRVHVAFLLVRSNWRELSGLVDLAVRWDAAQIVVSQMTWTGTQDFHAESLLGDPALWPEVRRALERAGQEASARGIEFCHHGPGAGPLRATCPENALNACFVSYRGDVSPCVFTSFPLAPGARATHFFEGRTHQLQPLIFGNVRERPLPEIWNSRPAREFRQSFRRRTAIAPGKTDFLPGPCRRCYKLREG